jgi:hypothetical protein
MWDPLQVVTYVAIVVVAWYPPFTLGLDFGSYYCEGGGGGREREREREKEKEKERERERERDVKFRGSVTLHGFAFFSRDVGVWGTRYVWLPAAPDFSTDKSEPVCAFCFVPSFMKFENVVFTFSISSGSSTCQTVFGWFSRA